MELTQQELNLIRDYILLPVAISIVNKNRLEIAESKDLLRSLYSSALLVIMTRMRNDLEDIRRQLKEMNINVVDSRRTRVNDSEQYPYFVRGKRGDFSIRRDEIKAEVGRQLGRYIADVTKPLGQVKV